jgi:hypothetical protein
MTFQHLRAGIIAMTILVWGRLAVGILQHLATVRAAESAPAPVGATRCVGDRTPDRAIVP